MTPEDATALRRPFPAESVGKLPKPYRRDAQKANCNECGGYHGLPAVHLDYVGHAATTDRLLTVDPEWTWDFLVYGPDGMPITQDRNGDLWIKLTVCGVTRIGVGDGGSAKERIGDAIRNAAMRFGVALDLWAKEDLVEFAQAARSHQAGGTPPGGAPPQTSGEAPGAHPTPAEPPPGEHASPEPLVGGEAVEDPDAVTSSQLKKIGAAMRDLQLTDRADALAYVASVIGREVTSRNELTKAEAGQVIDVLERDIEATPSEGAGAQ